MDDGSVTTNACETVRDSTWQPAARLDNNKTPSIFAFFSPPYNLCLFLTTFNRMITQIWIN